MPAKTLITPALRPVAVALTKQSSTAAAAAASPAINENKAKPTDLWGHAEENDFVKTPRSFLYIRRIMADDPRFAKVRPHHLLLLLALSARKFRKKSIQAHWYYLGRDLGVKKDAVRKLAYQLEKAGLLTITRFKKKVNGAGPTPGFRNDRNTFDLTPFVKLVQQAYDIRKKSQAAKKKRRLANAEVDS